RAHGPDPLDPRPLRHGGAARRAQHEGRHGHLRDRARPRLRLDHRDRAARRGPARPAGHRGVPGGSLTVATAAGASSSAILEVADLSVTYGAIQALNGVGLRLAEGEIVTLIGANGAGKTTTLRAIMGLVRSSGSISYRGESIRTRAT